MLPAWVSIASLALNGASLVIVVIMWGRLRHLEGVIEGRAALTASRKEGTHGDR